MKESVEETRCRSDMVKLISYDSGGVKANTNINTAIIIMNNYSIQSCTLYRLSSNSVKKIPEGRKNWR